MDVSLHSPQWALPLNNEELYWVSLPHATFGLLIEVTKEEPKGVVIWAPPISRWTIGKSRGYVLNYYKRKGALIVLIT